jgi:hypothetical protein
MHALRNSKLYLELRPDLGGRIDHLVDVATDRDWLWHPKDYGGQARHLPIGASFDDHWTGGWDEIFPNDAATTLDGRELPVHGELWSQPWDLMVGDSHAVWLRRHCQTVPVTVDKRITLARDEAAFRVVYDFASHTAERLPYLFKLHPAIAIAAGDELLMPEALVSAVDLGFSDLLKSQTWQPWTGCGLERVLGPDARVKEFLYAKDLGAGWCGIRDGQSGKVLRLAFSKTHFPYVWLFQIYGGWRDHYVVVPEPATTMPWNLEDALNAGTCALLGPRERRRYEVLVTLEEHDPEMPRTP